MQFFMTVPYSAAERPRGETNGAPHGHEQFSGTAWFRAPAERPSNNQTRTEGESNSFFVAVYKLVGGCSFLITVPYSAAGRPRGEINRTSNDREGFSKTAWFCTSAERPTRSQTRRWTIAAFSSRLRTPRPKGRGETNRATNGREQFFNVVPYSGRKAVEQQGTHGGVIDMFFSAVLRPRGRRAAKRTRND